MSVSVPKINFREGTGFLVIVIALVLLLLFNSPTGNFVLADLRSSIISNDFPDIRFISIEDTLTKDRVFENKYQQQILSERKNDRIEIIS